MYLFIRLLKNLKFKSLLVTPIIEAIIAISDTNKITQTKTTLQLPRLSSESEIL